MALTKQRQRSRNAVYQARWRLRRDAQARSNPEVAERALVQAAEACLNYPYRTDNSSDAERTALADKLAEQASRREAKSFCRRRASR